MAQLLSQFVVDTCPNGNEADASHLSLGKRVAITEEGLTQHNTHKMWNIVAASATLGSVSLPLIIGGGIGLAIGGEAVGIGLAELGIIGASTGATVGKIVDKPLTGHMIDGKHETLSFVDMVGVVKGKSRRWWDQPGYDVKVTWTARNAEGHSMTFTAHHNPEQLFGLKSV